MCRCECCPARCSSLRDLANAAGGTASTAMRTSAGRTTTMARSASRRTTSGASGSRSRPAVTATTVCGCGADSCASYTAGTTGTTPTGAATARPRSASRATDTPEVSTGEARANTLTSRDLPHGGCGWLRAPQPPQRGHWMAALLVSTSGCAVNCRWLQPPQRRIQKKRRTSEANVGMHAVSFHQLPGIREACVRSCTANPKVPQPRSSLSTCLIRWVLARGHKLSGCSPRLEET